MPANKIRRGGGWGRGTEEPMTSRKIPHPVGGLGMTRPGPALPGERRTHKNPKRTRNGLVRMAGLSS